MSQPAPSEDPGDIGVVLVNFFTAPQTLQLIRLLSLQFRVASRSLVLVDNSASLDPAGAALLEAEAVLDYFTLVRSAANLGFAGGVNLGVAALANTVRYVWLLNTDAHPEQNALVGLRGGIDSGFGIVGSVLVDGAGCVESLGGRRTVELGFPSHLLTPAPPIGPTVSRAWVHGASMMISRDVWDRLDGFDERFFMYFEEVDFCYRARSIGVGVGVCPESVVVHLGGGSLHASGTNRLRDVYLARNYLLFLHRNVPRVRALLTLPAWFCITLSARLYRRQWSRADAFALGARLGIRKNFGPLPPKIVRRYVA